MECTVCLEVFDHEARRPKVLPCGHTLCLRCLQNPAVNNTCPQDRQVFQGNPLTFPDNFALLAVVAEASAGGVCCDLCRRLVSQRPGPGVAELRREVQELRRSVEQPSAGVTELQSGLEDLRNELSELRRSVQGQQQRGAQPPRLELDVKELSRNRGLRRERNDLLLGDRLKQVRKLTDLDCGVDAAWAEAVLLKVGPHVEELQVSNVQLQHLRAIQGMSALKTLHLQCYGLDANADVPLLPLQLEKLTVEHVRTEHLLSLQWMPKLRDLSLGLTSTPRIPLTFSPMPDHCGIQVMGLAFCDTKTMLSLVRAHATTIVTLRVFLPSAQRYQSKFHHPNLPRRLHECGLVALRSLIFTRIPTSHDATSCRAQLGHFRAHFGRDVDVLDLCCKCVIIYEFQDLSNYLDFAE